MYELSDDINNIKMHWGFAEIKVRKNENVFFHKHLLNMDISLNNLYKALKCSACIHEIWKQGSMSQDFDLGPRFYFMKCRNLH